MSTIALLTAGGIGSRTHQDIPKQFLSVNNKLIIVYTLEAFQKHPLAFLLRQSRCIHVLIFIWKPTFVFSKYVLYFEKIFLFQMEKTCRIVLSNFVDYSGQGAEIIL